MWRIWTKGWGPRAWWLWFTDEGFPIWVAWLLPRRIALWVFVRVFAAGDFQDCDKHCYERVYKQWEAGAGR
jgi:hypothetical protein